MLRKIASPLLCCSLLLWSSLAMAATIHVNNKTATPGDGTTWATPLTDLSQALESATSGDQIWIAAGQYTPTGSGREASFVLKPGVSVYGGFAGNEASLDQRDTDKYQTILSGDIGMPGNPDDNAFHVVTGADDALLDNLTISDGYSQNAGWEGGDTLSLQDLTTAPRPGFGAGLLDFKTSTQTVGCLFKDNHALMGGAIFSVASGKTQPRHVKTTFWQNSGLLGGGGAALADSDALFVSCEFDSNLTDTSGGGLLNTFSSSPRLLNTIFRNNEAKLGGGVADQGSSSPIFYYTTFTGNTALEAGPAIHQGDTANSAVLIKSVVWDNVCDNGDNRFSNGAKATLKVEESTIQNGYKGKLVFQANPSLDRKSETMLNVGYKSNSHRFRTAKIDSRLTALDRYAITKNLPSADAAFVATLDSATLQTIKDMATPAPAVVSTPATVPAAPSPAHEERVAAPEMQSTEAPVVAAPAPEPRTATRAPVERPAPKPAPSQGITPKTTSEKVATQQAVKAQKAAPQATAAPQAATPQLKESAQIAAEPRVATATPEASPAPPVAAETPPVVASAPAPVPAAPDPQPEEVAMATPPSSQSAQTPQISTEPLSSAQQMLKEMDFDGNGCVTINEAPPRLQQRFWQVDTSGDGCLSERELDKLLQRQKKRAGQAPQARAQARPMAPRKSAPAAAPSTSTMRTQDKPTSPVVAKASPAPAAQATQSAAPVVAAANVPYAGYTLFAPMGGTETYLVDMDGKTVKTWTSKDRSAGAVYLLDNGNLLRTVDPAPGEVRTPFKGKGASGGIIQEISPRGQIVWEYTYISDKVRQHHDIEPLPNGNVLLLAWELKNQGDLNAAGASVRNHPDKQLWVEHIVEVRKSGPRSGYIVWEWHAWDHLVQNTDSNAPNYATPSRVPQRIDVNYNPRRIPDWQHANSIDYNPVADQIVLSLRNQNEIWVIDHSTSTEQAASNTGGLMRRGGDLLFRWGNPAAYGSDGEQTLFGQHDARWITGRKPGEETILIFNNGDRRTRRSDVVEIKPAYYLRSTQLGAQVVWSYAEQSGDTFFADHISGAQRLPGGTTLICDGTGARLFEVTPKGKVVWDYQYETSGSGPGNDIFRATRLGINHPGVRRVLR